MRDIQTIKKEIQNNKTYNQVLQESLGGVMYNIRNKGKYQDQELFSLIDELEGKTDYLDGIMQGAIKFIEEGRE